jgi:hypothetical protein
VAFSSSIFEEFPEVEIVVVVVELEEAVYASKPLILR